MEHLIKMDDLGVPLFQETPICLEDWSSPQDHRTTQNWWNYALGSDEFLPLIALKLLNTDLCCKDM